MRNISDTARWVAYYRALESERPDACFHDPYARLLVGEKGRENIPRLPGGASMSWTISVRTCVFDEFVRQAVEKEGVDTVINLACGLDTRPYRLPLPPNLHWIEIDLPELMEYKEEKLANVQPKCVLERVKLDLTDIPARTALFSRIAEEARQVFILSEGFLVYLTSEQVTSLASDLHSYPNFRWWSTELVSPYALKLLTRQWEDELAAANIHFHFAPADGTKFFQRLGWQTMTMRSTIEEAARLHREMPLYWGPFWRLVMALFPKDRDICRNLSMYLLMQRV